MKKEPGWFSELAPKTRINNNNNNKKNHPTLVITPRAYPFGDSPHYRWDGEELK
jgi:hypothetical protein